MPCTAASSSILRQLQDLIEKEGVQPIEAVGQQFDPNVHEAVMRADTDDYPDNTIVEEFQRGYTLGDKVSGRAWSKSPDTP